MNKLFALELLGFENQVDFTVDFSGTIDWLSADPQPSDAEMQAAWDANEATIAAGSLDVHKASMKKRADGQAEIKRNEYISSGSGQALAYDEKARQAQEFADGGYVNPENYPFIDKEATSLGVTPTVLADDILAQRAAWIEVGSSIEALRRKVKMDIDAAATVEDVDVLMDVYEAALEAL